MTHKPEKPAASAARSNGPLRRVEFDILLTGIAIAGLLWAFVELAQIARAGGEPHAFDASILLAFRHAGHPDQPIGPLWLEGAVRDVTALGSATVLFFITIVVTVYLMLIGKLRVGLFMLATVALGQAISSFLKLGVDRPRPELVSHLVDVHTLSFPSGHAMLSAVTYLTLGALAARFLPGRVTRAYVLSLAVLVTLMVGVSRVYLGVHWPSDVLAGWCAGFVWALLCWLAARLLQRRGVVEDQK
jgi:undecaprenyl-diphosphatase